MKMITDEQKQIFTDYILELQILKREPITQYVIDEYFKEIQQGIESSKVEWIDIDKGNGFMVVAKTATEFDYFIVDIYCKPEFRRRHLAKRAVKKYIEEHQGSYCIEFTDDNQIARLFWDNIGQLEMICKTGAKSKLYKITPAKKNKSIVDAFKKYINKQEAS